MLFAHHNTVKTANLTSRINFYFVTGFYSKYDICIVLPFGHLILNLEVIEQYLETAVDSVYPDNDNERRFVALVTANRLKLQKCDARSKDFQLFILSSE